MVFIERVQSNPINAAAETKEKKSKLELRGRERLCEVCKRNGCVTASASIEFVLNEFKEYSQLVIPLKYSDTFQEGSRAAIPLNNIFE